MKDKELVNALREHAEWQRGNEWETPITLGDDLVEAADRIANQNTHILALQKEIEGLRNQNEQLRGATALVVKESAELLDRRWIPVTERLPENGVNVLCWYEYFRYGDFNAMFATYGIGYQFHGNWGGEVANGRNAKVLAWMPLPNAPEVEL